MLVGVFGRPWIELAPLQQQHIRTLGQQHTVALGHQQLVAALKNQHSVALGHQFTATLALATAMSTMLQEHSQAHALSRPLQIRYNTNACSQL